ncbi:MAG: dCTP deaminase [Nitrososphaerales archaeon]
MVGLSDRDIKARLREKDVARRLVIEPLSDEQIGPGSVNLTLGNEVGLRRKGQVPYVDPKSGESVKASTVIKILKKGEEFWLQPKEVVLWLSVEYIKMPHDLQGFIYPRSSWLQLFLSTTGFVDAGFEGKLVIEVVNLNEVPLVLRQGDRVCQIVFTETKTPSTRPYNGKYQGREHLEPSKVWQDYL